MLRKIRVAAAILCFALITLLFLDFSGTLHAWFGFMAKIQFLPALLALNVGVVAALVVLTLLFGRIYCSVICPLGVMQDLFGRLGRRSRKNRYAYSPALNLLRGVVLVLFLLSLTVGTGIVVGSLARVIAPYSAYGRIAQSLLAPLWGWGNNLLAGIAERADSYAFYSTEVWVRSGATLAVAVATLLIVGVLAWRNGRTWCNTVCPVGTLLGFLAKFSLFKPVIDTSKCNGCGLCARNCKAACIDSKHHAIDYSRCVACMDCIEKCNKGAISYTRWRHPAAPSAETGAQHNQQTPQATQSSQTTKDQQVPQAQPSGEGDGITRRRFLATTALVAAASAVRAQEKKVDGGLAVILDKRVPKRAVPVVPPGAVGIRHFSAHCTGCQLCVAVCPNGVLRPSGDPGRFMQPESSYERGYCRPECTKCSEVCPTGAIRRITTAEKSSIQIGRAVWVKENCIPLVDGVECGNCARHCPAGAIQMVSSDPARPEALKIPVVNPERCIGCGACENLCPARPFSAIYVEGDERHRTL